jgi:hypothetical protein
LPRERRIQTLGPLRLLDERDHPELWHRSLIADLEENKVPSGVSMLVYHEDLSYRGPSTWLTLNPRLAGACGWKRDPDSLIGWRDHHGPVVRSMWWRSGWLDSTPWVDHGEVGEGWLVLAQARGLKRLADQVSNKLAVAWQVERDFLEPGRPSRRASGIRALKG